jgi:hypothetical protein
MVVASTPDAAARRVFIQDGNALSGIPFGGDSQNATIIAAWSSERSPASNWAAMSGNARSAAPRAAILLPAAFCSIVFAASQRPTPR